MNTEDTVAEVTYSAPVSSEASAPNGDGQQGQPGTPGKSRRRRRKRKNRSAAGSNGAPQVAFEAGGDESGGVIVMEGESLAAAAAPAPRPQQANGNGNGQQQQRPNGQAGEGGGSRWKKRKFRRANGGGEGQPQRTRPEPGNSVEGSFSGQRRKQKQRGPRAFVGPMDHSYREANGNFGDSPSTINIHQGRRHNGNGRAFNEDRLPPELLTHQRPVAIPEGAPTHIYFFIEDLFFTAKIQEAARLQGVKVAFMKGDKDVAAHLAELPEHDHPSLIVVDLNNSGIKPLTLVPKLRSKLKKGTSIVGFLSHLQGDLKAKAVEAGCDTVMPRAAFSQNLPNLLRRYGVVEEDNEPNFNQ